jgi:hypothetical protein
MNDFSLMANNQNLDNPLYESVPPNWKPSDEIDNLAGIPEIYSGYILAATGPKDSRRRYFNVLDMMRNDERYENGSMFGHAVGLLLGGVVSPSTWIPIGTEVKAASLSTRMLQDIPKVLPGITASAAAHRSSSRNQSRRWQSSRLCNQHSARHGDGHCVYGHSDGVRSWLHGWQAVGC